MKIAIVSQARDPLLPPNIGSVALCSREIAAALSSAHDVRIYGINQGDQKDIEFEEGGVRYKLFAWTRADRLAQRVLYRSRRLHRLVNRGYLIPIWGSRLLAPQYCRQVAGDLAKDPVDVVLLQHSAIPASAIRRALPEVPIILQMHAPIYAPSLSRPYLRAIRKVDAVSGVSWFVARDARQKLGIETFRI